jgi:hypothetical protein
MGFFDHTGECSLTSARTASPAPITVFSGVKRGFRGDAVDGRNPLHDFIGNWDQLNLIFPVYLKLMTGFPTFQPEELGGELLH